VIDLSIVIVAWNSLDVLVPCLESIETAIHAREEGRLETETILVDNGSEDGTVEGVRSRFPWVRCLPLPENRGFAAGNNVGLREARGRHVVALNSDTVVLPGGFERCVAYLDAHPDVGVVGPQLLNPDGSKQNSIHSPPSLWTEFLPIALLETLFPARFPSKRRTHDRPIDVPAILGAAMFVRREVLEEVGLMPEDYFFFLEETDWCTRIRAAGWRVVHVPDVTVVHLFGASSKKKLPAATRIEFQRSLDHFFRKHRGPVQARLVAVWRFLKSVFYVAVRAPAALVSARGRERWKGDLHILRWHLRGRPLEGFGFPRGTRILGESAPRLRRDS